MSKRVLHIAILLSTVVSFQFCAQKPASSGIYFEKGFFELQQEADRQNKNFCVVLSHPECPPCEWFYNRIYTDTYQSLRDKTLFNFVDVTQPQNNWYQQLIASKGVPSSLFFSSEGNLLAIVNGGGKASFDCLTHVADGSYHCSSYAYKSPVLQSMRYPDVIELFNVTLHAKLLADKGEDASAELKRSMDMAVYPYNLWLHIEAARRWKQEEEAIEASKRLLSFKEPLYAVLYAGLYEQAEHIVKPGLTAADIPKLSVDHTELDLGVCHFGDSIDFAVRVRNTGESALHVYGVNASCTCVRVMGNDFRSIEPGGGITLDFRFTADVAGDVRRNIFIVTNDIRPVTTIRISAQVKK